MENGVGNQRWQRKAMEQGVQRLVLAGDAANSSLLSLSNLSLSTPVLSGPDSARASPARIGAARSPSRSCSTPSLAPPLGPGPSVLDGSISLRPGSGGRTPNRLAVGGGGSRTPGGDRFIPCRSATDLENSYNALMRAHDHHTSANNNNNNTCGDDNNNNSYTADHYQRQLLRDTLNAESSSSSSAAATAALSSSSSSAAANGQFPPTAHHQQQQGTGESRVLCFRARAPPRPPASGYTNQLRVLYSASKAGAARRAHCTRHIPSAPERVLDAPALLDDYYLHVLDWSGGDRLAVALGSLVYVWHASAGDITCLAQLDESVYVSSVAWVGGGGGGADTVLAVADSSGCVQLWDAVKQQRLRRMAGHRDRVGALSWNAHIVSSGSRAGDVHHHDVRCANHHVGSFSGHVQEVCGVRWSPDGRLLATGGNDNQLLVWDSLAGLGTAAAEPLHALNQHQAAVKALAWCPWSVHVLASGGGTADRTIRFWNGSTGQLFNTVTTNSQVSALLWSSQYKEILSGHGFSFNQLTLWKYPQMEKIADLTGHESRVLEMVLSPDGTTVASAAGDETIRLWKCWETDKTKKTKPARPAATSALKLQSIR